MKYYFKNKDSILCYPEDHFKEIAEEQGLAVMNVYEAIPFKEDGIFWCKKYHTCGEKTEGTCGKFCKYYSPINKVSGCCKHYSKTLYEAGELIELKF